ncbi:hypothetical protein [Fervidobacterium sp. 2310opik-2]|uniref:hypothetical protein n=1 Tax=Fervidobacterium sp. 2310opik-2 TaxID=1755815 RepID=UPI0013E03FFF|nr:hypothetical protein [Fervidobacterium sp. 2310opik-2]KAF2962163.1 hypothetical protein AS161_05630 [Fervidobacterium sp. 2310opik-2]
MEREEIERKLLETIDKIESHVERYEKDLEELNVKINRLTDDLDDTWSAFRNAFITIVTMFIIMTITWFFPFQVGAYGYLSVDDVRRKLIALSVEALVFGVIMLLMLGTVLTRRFRR